MRRASDCWDRIVDWNNLLLAVSRALRGKRYRRDALQFVGRLEDNLSSMMMGLVNHDLELGEFRQFVVHDPKERVITAPSFRERVLHHAIMNICEPIFERGLIADTYACRRGKGREAAVVRARQFARRYPYFLTMDIRKYFDSIPHGKLMAQLSRLFKEPPLLELFDRILSIYRGMQGRGIPIGSLTSQHFANFYLSALDRFIKESLRQPGYVRYMDDMAIWGESTCQLKDVLGACRDFLREHLDLELKPNAAINRTCHGMDFLGARVFPTHVILNRRSRLRFRRKLFDLESLYAAGALSDTELQHRATALVAFARSAGISSWKFRANVLQQVAERGHKARTA